MKAAAPSAAARKASASQELARAAAEPSVVTERSSPAAPTGMGKQRRPSLQLLPHLFVKGRRGPTEQNTLQLTMPYAASVGGTKRRAHAGGKGVVEKRTPNDSGVRRPSRGGVSGGDATLAPKRGSRRGPPKPSNIARRNWATTVADPAAQPALVSRVAHAKAARTRGGPTWPDEVYDEFLP